MQSVEETVHLEEISLGVYLKDKEEILPKEVVKEGIIEESDYSEKRKLTSTVSSYLQYSLKRLKM